jgi:hypothetical protein
MKMIGFGFVAVLAFAVPAAGPAATNQQPRLRVLDSAPLVVRGTGFKGHELVSVVYRAQARWTRTATASAAGTFTVRFPAALQLCPPGLLTARGARGSSAVFKPPRTMCPQPPPEP